MAYTGPQRDSAAVCSVPNTERLEQMLDEAGFARLVLTAESERTEYRTDRDSRVMALFRLCREPDLNRRHMVLQTIALPTELPRRNLILLGNSRANRTSARAIV